MLTPAVKSKLRFVHRYSEEKPPTLRVERSRYTLVKGQFWIHYPDNPQSGPEPDGDSVRFKPDNRAIVNNLPWHSNVGPDFNARGLIQLRYEGIDTMETHIDGAHQDLTFANAARNENLRKLGFKNIVFFDHLPNKVKSVDVNPLPGFLLANGVESNGRLLGLVYTGPIGEPDGASIFVDHATLDASINVHLVRQGLAYVEAYDTMPIDLVRHIQGIGAEVRETGAGLFAGEHVNKIRSAQVMDLPTLESLIMWPKLFRRLVKYFAAGFTGLGGFDAWIRADPVRRDDSLRLPSGEKGNMHDTYRIDGDSLSLAFNSEELIIAPDPAFTA
jgi:hypothetical protein